MYQRRINPNLSEGLNGDAWQQLLADVRGHGWKQYGGRLDVLAEKAYLSRSTVEAFMWGDTKSPHFFTIFKILVALGQAQKLLQALQSDEPITLIEARKRRTETKG